MTKAQYEEFDTLREDFRRKVKTWSRRATWLAPLQRELISRLGYGDYELETPIVYNKALDDVKAESAPIFLVVADNPGKNEQKASSQRYLVGQSGKLAQGWFSQVLGMDFRSAAVIVNKTPLHTPKTAELRLLKAIAREKSPTLLEDLEDLLDESQRGMANLAYRLHACLDCFVWVSGYGELRKGKLFWPWAQETAALYQAAPRRMREKIWVFKHFSMNQFSMEYNRFQVPGKGAAIGAVTGADGLALREGSREEALARLEAIGSTWRTEILGL
ncbi:MAG: hypothetical protein FD137_1418 [Spirochaetes bacterium]|nr:MAG: hypothetical protein FD137_1418 [Spirochaetota bacterium]